MEMAPELRIQSLPGVCPVEEDTRQLAKIASGFPKGSVLDMGTGSGYIGIYLAKSGFSVDAVDVSEQALENAARNARNNDVSLNLIRSSLFTDVRGRYDLIVFNPPRIPQEGGATRLVGGFIRRHRFLVALSLPLVSLFFGKERLGFILDFVRRAKNFLNADGSLLMHLTDSERQAVRHAMPEVETREMHAFEGNQDKIVRIRYKT